ncbi:DegT/DnrJ/EryC1/StrS family aminotransferase [Geobacter sulfurreducens]|uniref:DegT/DnrJ/EryC1/StrS family aminotransferase n=1 Tax=Geobacter sulfurreducens TaxID=35554 RepID=UPI0001D8F1B3|nr:DegT/DnrJ/EryC1/StrS family aminotransferase [Geobacter sulfurreducens]ADI84688.1 aminotransferase, AHBA_syn family [Geobacter sulfurreducens KN400]
MSVHLFVPTFRVKECLDEIEECLVKGWTGLGYKTVAFEEAWKSYTGLQNAHFLSSNTVGLHLAVKMFKSIRGWCDGDEVITTPLTFISTNHAISYENLTPVFADIDEYLCLDPVDVEKKITDKTRAVIFVGIGGNSGRYQDIVRLCQKYNLVLILDAAHMAGTRLNGKQVGQEADATVFSFQAVKNLPTADSGMICFKDHELDELARKYTWLGINKDTYARTTDKGAYKWHYEVEHVGFKYHGNSIMAAIGLVQLRYLDQDNSYRRQLCNWYEEALSGNDKIKIVPTAPNCESSRHLFQISVDNRDELMLALNESDIFPGVHYRDNTEYRIYESAKGSCSNASYLSKRLISLPLHLRLSKIDVDYVVSTLNKLLQ